MSDYCQIERSDGESRAGRVCLRLLVRRLLNRTKSSSQKIMFLSFHDEISKMISEYRDQWLVGLALLSLHDRMSSPLCTMVGLTRRCPHGPENGLYSPYGVRYRWLYSCRAHLVSAVLFRLCGFDICSRACRVCLFVCLFVLLICLRQLLTTDRLLTVCLLLQ